jgi:hypothetical protein
MSDSVQIDFHVEPDEWLDIEQLIQMYHPFNSQMRNDAELTAIERSIQEEGFTAEILVLNRVNQKLVSGHGRVQACWNMGYRGKLPIIWKEYQTEEEHRRAMLRWNKARGHQDAELEKREIEALIETYGQEQTQADMGYTDEEILAVLQAATDSGGNTGRSGGSQSVDPITEWQGMPVFEQEDNFGAIATVKVHIATKADLLRFAQLMGQTVTEQSKSIWFPKQEKENLKAYIAL